MDDRTRSHNDPAYGIAPEGHRMPPGLRLGVVRLQVSDLERSLAFYGTVLGLAALDRAPGRVVLGTEGGEPLVELRERSGAVPLRRPRLGLFHYALLLPDRAALGRFVAHLGRIGARVGASDHLVSEALYLQDPDGLGIEAYADRPRETWRQHGGQIAMDARPLDLEEVARAAGGEPWSGMPAGTTVGHVHLHVGDLVEAEAFYHRALGLDKVVWSYPGALFLSAGGYHHHLGTNTWAAGASPAGEDDPRLLEWELVLPRREDAEAAARSLEAGGYPVAREGDEWSATDPWGTALRLRTAAG